MNFQKCQTTLQVLIHPKAWAYHMEYFLANQKYNVEPSSGPKGDGTIHLQTSGPFVGTDGAAIENYIPLYTLDPFSWIPKGLMWDLMDVGENSILTNVNDNVSGYTIQQIFAALQSDVNSTSAYKARLLLQNPSNPTNTQINALFASYGF